MKRASEDARLRECILKYVRYQFREARKIDIHGVISTNRCLCVTGQPILCESCCLSEYIYIYIYICITCREVLSPKLLLGIVASKTIPRSRAPPAGSPAGGSLAWKPCGRKPFAASKRGQDNRGFRRSAAVSHNIISGILRQSRHMDGQAVQRLRGKRSGEEDGADGRDPASG